MVPTSVHALRETQPNVPLVERLVTVGLISEQQLRQALNEKRRRDRPLGEILVALGMISERVLSETLGQLLGDEIVDLRAMLPDPRALGILPKDIAERYSVFPLEYEASEELLTLAVTETFDLAAVDEMSRALDARIAIGTVVAAEAEIKTAVRKFYGVALTIADILREIDADEAALTKAAPDTGTYEHPLNRLIDAIIVKAIKRDASAVHFEPELGFTRVRFRIDGVLRQVMALHQDYWPEIAAQLIAKSNMTDGAPGVIQQGRMLAMLGTRRKTLHFSRRATQRGEDFIIGIVAQNPEVKPLENLGLDSKALTELRVMMARPDGLFVVAGPPGGGKTTTLYSLLAYRSDESVSIMTLEDAVSCDMPLIRQTSIAPGDRTDDAALELLLFQNADVLVVDELLDKPTAATTLRAAMAGRQVFTALSAKSVVAVLPRLQELGLPSQLLAGNIAGIVAQRLIRKLCSNCKRSYAPEPFERRLLGVSDSKAMRLYREGGCSECHYLGYRGRVAVFEVLVVDEALDELLARGATTQEIQWAVSAARFTEVAEEAVLHVIAGTTSLSEVSRVVDLSARLR